ncbi:hypothetical protein NX801_22990 [Streptomyces sp. LP05-1]|uniref:Galactose oxidase n=1 Tax=Streptomyces pyxinae TaxID=2970734 RepID=A0ABT2CM10_9ACTN|nr:kelch repeat-containing protein [Streptomyces sp. LP05-1]MCS0638470.1 hypothetical protein [Streptomyces sp. LP05-1]
MRIFTGRDGATPTRPGITRPRWFLAAALAAALVPAAAPAHAADGGWTPAPAMEQARTGHGTTTAPCPEQVAGLGRGQCVYVIGGHPLEAALSAHAYSPETRRWAKLPSMTVGRSGLAAVTAPCPKDVKQLRGTCVYAVGGTNGSGSLTTVEAYSPATNAWANVPMMPTARGFLGAAAAPCPDGGASAPRGTCVYVVGGSARKAGASTALNTVEAYSPEQNGWTALPKLPTPRRSLGVTAASCPRSVVPKAPVCVYAVGGVEATQPVSTTEVFHPAARAWVKLPSAPTARRGMGVAAAPCPGTTRAAGTTCVYGVGGAPTAEATATGKAEVFAPADNAWSALPALPQARFGFGATAAPCTGDLDRVCLYAPGGAVGTTPSAETSSIDVTALKPATPRG